jgi:hypothetical protein
MAESDGNERQARSVRSRDRRSQAEAVASSTWTDHKQETNHVSEGRAWERSGHARRRLPVERTDIESREIDSLRRHTATLFRVIPGLLDAEYTRVGEQRSPLWRGRTRGRRPSPALRRS